MAWSFVGVSAAVTVTGTPLTLTEPAGVADGDLLIACIASRTTSTTSIVNTGWTMVNEQKTNNTATNTSAIASGIMLYQIRSGTPDLTFTLPAAGTSVCFGRMVAYRGNATSTPVDANTAVTTATNTTAVSVAGLTTTALNDLIVAMCAGGQEAAWSAFANVGAATWNSADKDATVTLSNSNRTATSSAAADTVRTTTQRTNGAAGKYYTEFLMGTVSGGTNVGINAAVGSRNNTSTCCIRASSDGSIYVNDASSGGIGSTYTAADVICMAWDAGAERVWFRKNGGNWNNDASANPATGTNGIDVSALPNVACCAWFLSGVSGEASTIRAVSADFTQAVPSGFSEWSANLGPLTASGATDTSTAPSTTAWIERADSNTTTGADTSLAIFDAIRTGTGATGNLTATASLGAGHVVIAGAFRLKEQAGAGAAAGTTLTAAAVGGALTLADGVAAGTTLTAAAVGASPILDAWNYATDINVTLSNSDRTATTTDASIVYATTINTNEARYVEITSGNSLGFPVVTLTDSSREYIASYAGSGDISTDFDSGSIAACGEDDTLGIALDLVNDKVWFRVNNGDWNNSPTDNPTTNSGGLATADVDNWTLYVSSDNAGHVWTLNAAADDFVYSAPSGFKSWIGETLVIDNVGAATGTGTATAAGDALKLADGAATGTSTVAALAISETGGTAAGAGVATGAGDALILAQGAGAGSTVALADGWSSIFVEAVGTATGTGSTAAAYDRGTPPDDAWDWTTAVPPTMTFSNGDRTVSL